MAGEENNFSNPKLIIPVVLMIIAAAVGIPLLLHYLANVKKNANAGQEAADDAKAADAQASALNIDKGRALAMIGAARTLYQEIVQSKIWVNSGTCVTALNLAQSSAEMVAMCTAYNVQLNNNQRDLKADVNQHVIGTAPWDASASQIVYYNDMI